jgi:hypothetical protein
MLSLINDDPASRGEGMHVADLEDLYLCEQCVAKLADGLLDWPRLIHGDRHGRIGARHSV